MSRLFAGFDVSTQGCKLVVIDPDAAAVVHVDALNYDRDLPEFDTHEGSVRGLGEGVSESDPRMWIEAVERLLARLAEGVVPAAAIRSISVSGQMHGLVALDQQGNLARPYAKLWNDFSTLEECELLTDAVGGVAAMVAEIANTQRTGYTAPKILHMHRHEPETFARTRTFLVVHNYINWFLTGGSDGGVACLEPGDASGTALMNPATGRWSRALLEAIDPTLEGKLPEVRPSDRSIGTIGAGLAERFGLDPACTVDAGCGDNMYAAVGTGNVAPGMVTVSLGTSGTAATVLDAPWVDPTGEIACYCDSTGRYLPLLCVSNMANGYNAALAHYQLTHEQFDELLTATPPGNEGRMLVPWYEGERTPDLPLAAPLTLGFGVADFTAERVCRAIIEGHVLNLHAGFVRMPVQPAEIRLTGGLARSASWRQTIADIFAAEVVPVAGEGAALGAALHAAWVWHNENGDPISLEELARALVHPEEPERTIPRPAACAAHAQQRELFAALCSRVRGLEADDPFAVRARLFR